MEFHLKTKNMSTSLPYDPAIPLLGIYSEKTTILKDTCTSVFTGALFTIARTWKQPRCPPKTWMDKDVVHIDNGIPLSHKKELIWVNCSEVDEARAWCTEWSKSEREKQISYINAYVWNLEKLYWWTHLQRRNRAADIENRLVNTAGEGEGGQTEKVTWTHTQYHVEYRRLVGNCYITQGAQRGAV